ncbi:MAG: GNAT family N-acetyltransferase [Planctomycetes bacterium]|nr:GNAT family N-acetyltransferase [Planctomycetota bacterium]
MENTGLIAAIHRSEQSYTEQVCRRETLAVGHAFFASEHPLVPECNFVGEATLDGLDDGAVAAVERIYSDRGGRCFGWTPRMGEDAEAFERRLAGRGYVRREFSCAEFRGAPPTAARGVRVLAARAMPRAYRLLVEQRAATEGEALASERTAIQLERNNDPQYDALVALIDDEPAGMAALHSVGTIGRMRELFVAPARRRRGVATALVAFVAAQARRWAMERLCATAPADDQAALGLLRGTGFSIEGTIFAFRRP